MLATNLYLGKSIKSRKSFIDPVPALLKSVVHLNSADNEGIIVDGLIEGKNLEERNIARKSIRSGNIITKFEFPAFNFTPVKVGIIADEEFPDPFGTLIAVKIAQFILGLKSTGIGRQFIFLNR